MRSRPRARLLCTIPGQLIRYGLRRSKWAPVASRPAWMYCFRSKPLIVYRAGSSIHPRDNRRAPPVLT